MKWKAALSFAAGAILSAIGFYYAFATVPMDELLWYMESLRYGWLLPAAAIGLFTFFLRALRWQTILGASVRIPFSSVYHAIMIGFMINSVLPARAGEIARPAILKKKEQVPFSLGLSTLATERILDAITLILLFVWMMGTVHIDPDLEMEFLGYRLSREVLEDVASGLIVFSLVLVCLIVSLNIPATRRLLKSGVLKMPHIIPFTGKALQEKIYNKISIPLTGIIDNIASGMSLVRFPGKLLICAVYSALIWLLQAVVFYVTAMGSPLIALSFSQLTAVFVIICFFIILPSVPGFWGIWEAGGVFGLAIFGVAARDALGFSLTVHVVLMFPVLFAGIVSVVLTGINIFQAGGPESEKK